MQRLLRLTLFTLLIAAFIGCDGGGDNGDGDNGNNGNDNYAVTATLNIPALGPIEFNSNEVFANRSGDIGFSFSAEAQAPPDVGPEDYTILISILSLGGEPLSTGEYEIGADDETEIVVNGSVVFDLDGDNLVFNATEGSGSIDLSSFSADGARGRFSFTATSPDDPTPVNVTGGAFDIDF